MHILYHLIAPKKALPAWFLWARLAGWEGLAAINEKKNPLINIKIYPNPARHNINITFPEAVFCNTLEIWDLSGKQLYSKLINERHKELILSDIDIPSGVYVVTIDSDKQVYRGKLSFYK